MARKYGKPLDPTDPHLLTIIEAIHELKITTKTEHWIQLAELIEAETAEIKVQAVRSAAAGRGRRRA